MVKKTQSIFKEETLSDIVQYCSSQEDFLSTFKDLQKALIERAMEGELAYHLGYKKHERSDTENARNGYGRKKIITDSGEVEVLTPRDRESS